MNVSMKYLDESIGRAYVRCYYTEKKPASTQHITRAHLFCIAGASPATTRAMLATRRIVVAGLAPAMLATLRSLDVQELFHHLHKFRKLAPVNIMRSSLDLHSPTMCRQILLRLLPGSIVQSRAKCWIGADQERRCNDVGEQGKQVTALTCLSKDTDHCFSRHLVQSIDLAFNIGLRPARVSGSNFGSQFICGTTNVPGKIGSTFFRITTTKVICRVLKDQLSKVWDRLGGRGSTCQHDSRCSTPGMPDQHGPFSPQSLYKRNRVISTVAQAI